MLPAASVSKTRKRWQSQPSRFVVDVLRKEVQGLVDAKPASIEDGDQSTVTNAGRLAVATSIEEPAHFSIGEDLRREAAAWLSVAGRWHLGTRAPRTSNELPRPPDMMQAPRYGVVDKRSFEASWQ